MDNMDPNHWYGVVAAVACGLGFRFMGGVIAGAGVAGVAVVVAACFVMLIDAGT